MEIDCPAEEDPPTYLSESSPPDVPCGGLPIPSVLYSILLIAITFPYTIL